MSKLALVDINNLGFASMNSGQRLSSGEQETTAIYGITQSLIKLKKKLEFGTRLIILWDGNSKWRRELYPAYKSNREVDAKQLASREAYKNQQDDIKEVLQALGLDQMIAYEHEADDLAGWICSNLRDVPGKQITLYTRDGDWKQLVSSNITWMNPFVDSEIINAANFEQQTEYKTPEQFLSAKALQGDSSDAITGVGGIGKKGAKDLLDKYGSVVEFLNHFAQNPNDRYPAAWKRLAKNEPPKSSDVGTLDAFRRNASLMNLIHPKVKSDEVILTRGTYNKDALVEICQRLSFQSVLDEINHIDALFGQSTNNKAA